MKKYKLTHETIVVDGNTLYRIRALRDFGDVKAGDLGGFIESKENLSHDGNAWVSGDAQVFGRAEVFDNAQVYGDAMVFDNAQVYGDAKVYDNACVFDSAKVYGDAKVYGNAQVSGCACVCHSARVFGNAKVSGFSMVSGNTVVYYDATDVKYEKGEVNDQHICKGTRMKKTTEEMISVMQASLEGKTIERTHVFSEVDPWVEDISPLWNWASFDYRAKTEPSTMYVLLCEGENRHWGSSFDLKQVQEWAKDPQYIPGTGVEAHDGIIRKFVEVTED